MNERKYDIADIIEIAKKNAIGKITVANILLANIKIRKSFLEDHPSMIKQYRIYKKTWLSDLKEFLTYGFTSALTELATYEDLADDARQFVDIHKSYGAKEQLCSCYYPGLTETYNRAVIELGGIIVSCINYYTMSENDSLELGRIYRALENRGKVMPICDHNITNDKIKVLVPQNTIIFIGGDRHTTDQVSYATVEKGARIGDYIIGSRSSHVTPGAVPEFTSCEGADTFTIDKGEYIELLPNTLFTVNGQLVTCEHNTPIDI